MKILTEYIHSPKVFAILFYVILEPIRRIDMVHLTDNDDNYQRCHGIHVRIFPWKDSTHKTEPEENLGGISWRRSKIFILVIKLSLIVKTKSIWKLSINYTSISIFQFATVLMTMALGHVLAQYPFFICPVGEYNPYANVLHQ